MDKEITAFIEKTIKESIETEVEKRVKEILKEQETQPRAAIIASKGTMDMAYPPLILAFHMCRS